VGLDPLGGVRVKRGGGDEKVWGTQSVARRGDLRFETKKSPLLALLLSCHIALKFLSAPLKKILERSSFQTPALQIEGYC
jgi:hypothetical protein